MKQCDVRARSASVVYQPLREMEVGRADRVEAFAVIGEEPEQSEFSSEASVESEQAMLSCVVEAQLRGVQFVINPSDPVERSFLDSNRLEWQWLVEPLKSGDHPLTLEFRPFLLDGRGQRLPAGDLRPIEVVIEVVVDRSVRARLGRMAAWVWPGWMWSAIASAIISVLVAGLWARVTDRRSPFDVLAFVFARPSTPPLPPAEEDGVGAGATEEPPDDGGGDSVVET